MDGVYRIQERQLVICHKKNKLQQVYYNKKVKSEWWKGFAWGGGVTAAIITSITLGLVFGL